MTTPILPAALRSRITLVLFDLDGVLTSEARYWDAARCTTWELLQGRDHAGLPGLFADPAAPLGGAVIPLDLIYEIKNRAVNSNWDLAFIATVLYLVAAGAPGSLAPSGTVPERLRGLRPADGGRDFAATRRRFFDHARGQAGARLLDGLAAFAAEHFGPSGDFFRYRGPLWTYCQGVFQDWLLGRKCLPQGALSTISPDLLFEPGRIAALLATLRDAGLTLGIATGRPWAEVLDPLGRLGLLEYFDPRRVVTFEAVDEAEALVAATGRRAALGKPHPYILLKAMDPDAEPASLVGEAPPPGDRGHALYVGDTASDVTAAARAGCPSLGVLTGVGPDEAERERRRRVFHDLGCAAVLDTALEIPAALGIPEW